MIISHRNKFVFFHNPLTGSDPVRRYLESWNEEPIVDFRQRMPNQPFYHNMSPAEAEVAFRNMGWNLRDYATITCVCNPFNRIAALYARIMHRDPKWRLRKYLGLPQIGLTDWLRTIRTDTTGGGGSPALRWRRYGAWTTDNWCAGLVDHVIRSENLPQELPALCHMIGIETPGPSARIRTAPEGPNPALIFDEESVALVEKLYATDLSAFGYSAPELRNRSTARSAA